ncbi:MAG: serine/threonine protein kinase [Agarilytica sp.]
MSSHLELEIPGYDIIEPIGRGGMASVYRARQHSFDRNVALKILKPDLSEDDAFCQRFVMESLIVAKLNHSHIVQVYDVGEVKNNYYIAMEFLCGGDLQKRLKEGLSAQESVSIIKQIASALDFAHRKHIIHRDLKPDNVMFREDEAAVLTDFGIAKETNADINLTQTGLIVGTPKYMSPEQIRGADPSPQGDIYSLGIMFYQLLCNRVPFHGADLVATAYQHFNEPVPLLPPHLSQFQELIEHMLAKTIEDRIPCGKDVVKELERIEKAHPIEIPDDETAVMPSGGFNLENDETLVQSGSDLQAGVETKVMPKSKSRNIASDPTLVKTENEQRPNSTPAENTSVENHSAPDNTENNTTKFTQLRESPFTNKAILGGMATLVIIVGLIFAITSNSPQEQSAPPAPITAVNTEEITALLLAAHNDIQNNRLRTGESNALSKYEQVLILSPGHPQALEGKTKVAKKYISLAKKAIQNKNFGLAQQHLDNATDIDSEVNTSKLQTKLNAAKRNQKSPISTLKQVQIAGLLENAKIYEQEGKISSPAGGNAIENYKKVLEIDPYNESAKARLAVLSKK